MNTHGNPNLNYAVQLVQGVCCLAGQSSYLDDIRTELQDCGVVRAIRDHDTPTLFEWLVQALSYQGISDAVAAGYMDRHGAVTSSDIAGGLSATPSCPKLGGYWRFYDCQYRKSSGTCSEPSHFDTCPLPRHPLRNGHLNQMAYSLFLFMRDVADGVPDRHAMWGEAVIGPLRNVYGVSDKVLAMTLSSLLLSAGNLRPLWFEVGADLVAIDTLVHNFLSRTGILRRLSVDHPYGRSCYQPGGCAAIIRLIASHIDVRQFNRDFPSIFPRFVQSAIWRYCAGSGLDICNGNRIDDRSRCDYAHCQMFRRCDRVALADKSREYMLNQ
jgi:hypothetical protein